MKKVFIISLLFISQSLSFCQWIESSRPAPAFPLFSFSFPSANTGFAVGYGNTMIKSTNGGVNWFNISFFSTTANDLYSVFFLNENTGWIGSTSDTVFYTTNSGSSWAPQIWFSSNVYKIFFTNSTTGWILTTPKLYRTTNAGSNWELINSQMGNDMYFYNSNIGWKTLYSGGSSTLYKTINGGSSWTPMHSTSDFRVIYSFAFVNENTGWAAGYREHILKTTDGGINWFQQRDMNNSTGFFSLDFINENTGWAIGDQGQSVYTVNGGNTWNQIPLNAGRGQVKFFNSATGWVVGNKVFKTTTGGFTFRNLQCTSLIEGFYDQTGNTMVSDTSEICIRNGSAPYQIIDSAYTVLNSNGTGSYNFMNAVNGVNYFIVLKHRNSLETWSSSPMSFNSNSLSYDFSTSSSQAYGNNLKQKGTRWTVYSGDVNKDQSVDLNDIVLTYNDAAVFLSGYRLTDINGDNFVDLSDIVFASNNASKFVTVIRP